MSRTHRNLIPDPPWKESLHKIQCPSCVAGETLARAELSYTEFYKCSTDHLFWCRYKLYLRKCKNSLVFRLQLKCGGTRWRTIGEVKGKLANGVGSQYSSHYLGTWCIQHYYRWCAHLGRQQSTELTPPANLNGLVRFTERRNLVSARVPSHFNWPLQILTREKRGKELR